MRIEQNSIFLTDLVRDIRAGRTIPAGMQRPYAWREADVLAFCDSLVRRYPIGGILTWRPSAELDFERLSRPRLGPIQPEVGRRGTRLILDGQNRLATVAWMLAEEGDLATRPDASPAELETWLSGRTLVYDGTDRSFRFQDQAENRAGLTIPARAAFSGHAQELRHGWDRWLANGIPEAQIEDFLDHWETVERGFKDARLVETLLDDASVDDARSAFLRICRTGVPMDDRDIEAAIQWLAPDVSSSTRDAAHE